MVAATLKERKSAPMRPRTEIASRQIVRILSAGAKGGPGKSFIVKNLAAAAAQAGLNVGVVDFDTQRTVTKWLARRQDFFPHGPRIAGYEANPENAGDARDVIALSDHEVLFIDTPPSIDKHPAVLKTLALGATLVIVPTKVGISDTESAEVLLSALHGWGVPTMALLNQVKPRATRPIAIARKRLLRMTDLCVVAIGDYSDFLAADEAGMGATEMRACLGSDLIDDVWADVSRRLRLEA